MAGFGSKRDAHLFLARDSRRLGIFSTCDGCKRELHGIQYRCLECIDMDLCIDCDEDGATTTGHASSHKMAELR